MYDIAMQFASLKIPLACTCINKINNCFSQFTKTLTRSS